MNSTTPNGNPSPSEKQQFQNGTKNWILVLLLSLILHLILENFLALGIVKTPAEIFDTSVSFFRNSGWIFVAVFTVFLLQIPICITIERLLFREILTEPLGIALHLFNTLLSLNTSVYFSTFYKFNSVAGTFQNAIYVSFSIKFWSYASYYRNVRNKIRKENNSSLNNDEAKKAQQNVNLKELFLFVMGDASKVYKGKRAQEAPRNIKNILQKLAVMVLILYFTAFIVYQVAIPESDAYVRAMDNQDRIKGISSFFKMTIIICAVWWLIFHVFNHLYFLPLMTALFGFEEGTFVQDWYNCENMTQFWVTWHIPVHLWFKEHVFKPAMQAGFSKSQASFLVFLVSGYLHEYFVSFPFRCRYGWTTIAMLTQVPICAITAKVQQKFGSDVGNFLFLTIHFLSQTSMYLDVYSVYIHNEYGSI